MITLDTTNGHNEIVINKFNEVSKKIEDIDLLYQILTRWADNQDIESITEFLNDL